MDNMGNLGLCTISLKTDIIEKQGKVGGFPFFALLRSIRKLEGQKMKFWNKLRSAAAAGRFLLRIPPAFLWFLYRQTRYSKSKKKYHNNQFFVNTFFPPYPSKAFNRFLDQTLSRQRLPLSTYMAVTPHCPCHCSHCSYGKHQPRKMSNEQLFHAVRQVRDLGASIIGFTGGEPLLRRDLAELVASVSQDTTTLIFTTGYGLTTERARELAEAGATCVVLGLESSVAEEHDRIRGLEGSFDRAREAAEACRRAGLFLSISTIGFAERLDSGELEKIYDLAKRWGVQEIRVPNPIATGGIAGCTARMLDADQLRRLSEFHIEHNRRKDDGPIMTCFARIESEELFGCGAGYHHLFIDAGGEVCPCDVTPLSFGNLNDKPLKAIWAEMADYFPHPRCGCMMAEKWAVLPCNAQLPLPAAQSRAIVAPPRAGDPLPAAYRPLLGNVAAKDSPAKNEDRGREPLRRAG
jgi:MoaA/NifB/PqqE/SkfB family radical SAM enzyme